LQLAETFCGAVPVNYEKIKDLVETLKEMCGGRGPDACIDSVGMEAHGHSVDALMDRVLQKTKIETDRSNVLRQVLQVCRKGGTVSIPGVYGGIVDKVPFGAAFTKGLTLKMGQTHVPRYMKPLLERIEKGEIDPSLIITHRRKLAEASECYELFNEKRENCVKVVLTP
jgi:threonine dehydrogenase-like Zn-dependent dehydrogenase